MSMDKILQGIVAVTLGASGGLTKLLSKKDKRLLKWFHIFAECFSSGFTGGIMFLICNWRGIDGSLTGAFCGIAGMIGPTVLIKFFMPMVKRVFNIDAMDDENEKGEKD